MKIRNVLAAIVLLLLGFVAVLTLVDPILNRDSVIQSGTGVKGPGVWSFIWPFGTSRGASGTMAAHPAGRSRHACPLNFAARPSRVHTQRNACQGAGIRR